MNCLQIHLSYIKKGEPNSYCEEALILGVFLK